MIFLPPRQTSAMAELDSRGRIKAKGAGKWPLTASLHYILKAFGLRRKAEPSAIYCPFIRLPTEIIQHIVSFLPLASKAAVILTNKLVINTIGTCSWKTLASTNYNTERTEFLFLLERDNYARYWLCKECAVLHQKEAWFWRCLTFECGLVWGFEPSLKWVHMNLIMQRHFYGKEFGLPIEALSQHWKSPHKSIQCREIIRHGKIIDNELFIKLRLTIDASLCPEKVPILICHHLSTKSCGTSRHPTEFQHLISCRLRHLRSLQKFCAFCTPILRRCKWCAIEYDLPISDGSKEPKLDIDVWANLGSGQDRNDPKWSLISSYGFPEDKPLKYELGSIRARYELGTIGY